MRVEARIRQVERRADLARVSGAPLDDVDCLAFAQAGRLGDFVVSLPALAALRRTYPDARVALIVAPNIVPLARCVPDVEVLPARSGFAMRDRLRTLRPRLAVCVTRSASLAWVLRTSSVPHRVGPGRRLYAPLFTRRVSEPRRGQLTHELEFALSFAHRAGAQAGPATFPLRVPEEARKRADTWLNRLLPDKPLVVLHPGTGGSCPAWSPRHYHQLARELCDRDYGVVVSLGPQDAALRDVGPAPVRPFVGDLQTLAGLLQRARLLVSNSTGPLHLAVALGAPTLAVHAPWASCGVERWGPYSERGWAIEAYHEAARSWSRRKRRRLGTELMLAVSPETVLAAALDILEGRAPV